jgi:hypothetical protein
MRLEADPALPDALPDRDHPARQRLMYLVSQLSAQLSRRSADVRRHLRPVADELSGPDFLELRLQLLVHTLADDLRGLADEVRELVTDDPHAALTAADLVRARLAATEPSWTPEALLPAAESLAHSTDLASGLLTHAVLNTAAPRAGWSPEWRRILVALRNHPAPGVRRRALDLTTAQE